MALLLFRLSISDIISLILLQELSSPCPQIYILACRYIDIHSYTNTLLSLPMSFNIFHGRSGLHCLICLCSIYYDWIFSPIFCMELIIASFFIFSQLHLESLLQFTNISTDLSNAYLWFSIRSRPEMSFSSRRAAESRRNVSSNAWRNAKPEKDAVNKIYKSNAVRRKGSRMRFHQNT